LQHQQLMHQMYTKLESAIPFLLDQTTKISKLHAQREFDLLQIDITIEQWLLLKVISEKETQSQQALALETKRDPAAITRTIDILVKKGLLIREAITNNRRQYHIKLTKEGRYFIVQNMPLINELRNITIKGFSKKEIDLLISMLMRIQKNLTQ
jgi:MarR family transcriptional regulator, transcriptional regulator for hemolysin